MRTISGARAFSIALAAALASACAGVKSPYAPSDLPTVSPDAAVFGSVAPPAFPAVSRPARVYVAVKSPVYSMHGSPLASRYLLYEDGTFALQYASANYPFFEYRGTYKEADEVITFEWGAACCDWGAKGWLSDDSLKVEYSDRMQHSDFLNGVYVRTR